MIRRIFDRSRPRSSDRGTELIVDVFGRADQGGWYAVPRLEACLTPTGGLLACGALQFVDGALRSLGGQPLDGAIRGLKLVAAGTSRPHERRLPLIARYAAPIDRPGAEPNEIAAVLVRWEPSLVLGQAAIACAAATADQLETTRREDFLGELASGLDRWTAEWLHPAGEVWSTARLWPRWVDATVPSWHK